MFTETYKNRFAKTYIWCLRLTKLRSTDTCISYTYKINQKEALVSKLKAKHVTNKL